LQDGDTQKPAPESGKRADILNAAMAEFAGGYEKASTDAIVRAAGVSKGLLFHHFGSKKDLFLYAYDYAIKTVMSEFYNLINLDERDILERWRQIALLKMDLMRKHPAIFNFIAHASFPDSDDVKENITAAKEKLAGDVYPTVFHDIDRGLFRDDIDADTAVRVIIFTMEGYASAVADPLKSSEDYYGEYGRYLSDLEGFIRLFKSSFYREAAE